MKPVVLSGFMGAGKSTVGPRLAALLGVGCIDTDAEIERATGKSIPQRRFVRERARSSSGCSPAARLK
jgi:shikimate kinase